jgi:hypothetical protein
VTPKDEGGVGLYTPLPNHFMSYLADLLETIREGTGPIEAMLREGDYAGASQTARVIAGHARNLEWHTRQLAKRRARSRSKPRWEGRVG